MATITMGSLETPASIFLVSAGKMMVINHDRIIWNKKGSCHSHWKRINYVGTPRFAKRWIVDLFKSSRTTKGKTRTCNAIFTLSEEDQFETAALTDSKVKAMTMATHQNELGQSGTRSGKSYHKDYKRLGQEIFGSTWSTARQTERTLLPKRYEKG